MPYANPTYDGGAIFGLAVKIVHTVNPPAEQINAFFGLAGSQSLFGGLRGRVFEVSGVLSGSDVPTLNGNEALILSYIDGVARVLVDTRGRTWSQVLVKSFTPNERVLQNTYGVSFLPYKALLVGLI